jgi:DNA-binding MarR family transcriptional regulator
MTVKEVATDLGVETDEILDLLKSNGIEGSAGSSIKDIADDHDMHPSDIVRMLKIEH